MTEAHPRRRHGHLTDVGREAGKETTWATRSIQRRPPCGGARFDRVGVVSGGHRGRCGRVNGGASEGAQTPHPCTCRVRTPGEDRRVF